MVTEQSGPKLLIAGPPGAGKTTAIAQISDIEPISTDVLATDELALDKAFTTVGMDYGMVTLADGETVTLYGTPGQLRFSFMWEILLNDAAGVIILINHQRPDPVADLQQFAATFAGHLTSNRAIVGISRYETAKLPLLESYAEALDAQGWQTPVIAVDVRERADVLLLIESLALLADG